MKNLSTRIWSTLVCWSVLGSSAMAQSPYFTDVPESQFNVNSSQRKIKPERFRTFRADTTALVQFLRSLPMESRLADRNLAPIISLPMPDGSMAQFRVWEYEMMEAPLAAKWGYIRTFSGQGLTDPTATIKLDWTAAGFHGMVISGAYGQVFIDPYEMGNKSDYQSYRKADYHRHDTYQEAPPVVDAYAKDFLNRVGSNPLNVCIGTQLRTYRAAVACTGEYSGFHGGTVAQASSAIATSMNRVNAVYERELAIRMVLVANNDNLIYLVAGTDPYTNNNGGTMLGQNQTNIDNIIGSANYDIGHVFSTGGGGIAGLGVVCRAGNKARGVTGSSAPIGDPFDIDYVAHEMGHQFGANHTFNDAANCGSVPPTTNAEPGSATTIMGYAGICGGNANLQNNSDAQFHPVSFNEIIAYVTTGSGSSCPVLTATGNQVPTANAGNDFIIPRSTTFFMNGSSSDPNGDALVHSWEQINVGGTNGTWDNPAGAAPLFRSFAPVTSTTRHFPRLEAQVRNTISVGEVLPTYARNIDFRFTVRDNRAGGGGLCFDAAQLQVDATKGPFQVTQPNTAGVIWRVGEFQTVTWDVANTTLSPINCANVAIQLSIDSGYTFPITLLANTPNDGIAEIQVPNNITNRARVRVISIGNVFYDMNDQVFNIQAASTPDFVLGNPEAVAICSGTSANTTLATGGLAGYSTNISLTASGAPSGATVSVSPNVVAPGNPVTVTLSNLAGVPQGSYTITVTATSGSIVKTRDIVFNIGSSTPPSTLTAPANNQIGVGATPTFSWAAVPGALSYTVEIATNPGFSPIAQTLSGIPTTSTTVTTPLAQDVVHYWRVRATNSCGLSAPSSAFVFKTAIISCNTFTSLEVPLTISSSGTPIINSTVTIPGAQGVNISDLDLVGLTFTHSYISDLRVRLTSPTGTVVTVVNGVCGSNANMNLTFDDQASVTTIPCPPTSGIAVRPQNPLSAFNGQNSAGLWTLNVADLADLDGGSLDAWALRICSQTSTPIPVTWLDFTGRKGANNTSSVLNWRVNEYNNAYYIVERSADGVNFRSIGQINATRDGNGRLVQYIFNDMKPITGRNFYRIRQVDVDGSFSFSPIVSLEFDRATGGWSIFPNPASTQVQINARIDARQVQVELLDAAGMRVMRQQVGSVQRGQVIQLSTAKLARGMYTVRIVSETGVVTEKLMLQ